MKSLKGKNVNIRNHIRPNALLKRMEDFTLDIEITENISVMRYLKSVLLPQRSLRIRKDHKGIKNGINWRL